MTLLQKLDVDIANVSSPSMNPSSSYDSDSSLTSTRYYELPSVGNRHPSKSNREAIMSSLEKLSSHVKDLDNKRNQLQSIIPDQNLADRIRISADTTPSVFVKETQALAQELRLADIRCQHLEKQLDYIRIVLKILYSDPPELLPINPLPEPNERVLKRKSKSTCRLGGGDFLPSAVVEMNEHVQSLQKFEPKCHTISNEVKVINKITHDDKHIAPAIPLGLPKQICVLNNDNHDRGDYSNFMTSEKVRLHKQIAKPNLKKSSKQDSTYVNSPLKKMDFEFKDMAKKCDKIITNLCKMKTSKSGSGPVTNLKNQQVHKQTTGPSRIFSRTDEVVEIVTTVRNPRGNLPVNVLVKSNRIRSAESNQRCYPRRKNHPVMLTKQDLRWE